MSAARPFLRTATTLTTLILGASMLTACGTADRLASVGKEPAFSSIEDPSRSPNYQPVRLPMPEAPVVEKRANSLWRAGSRAFFKDQRAARVGDILTVNIQINDRAQLQNQTTRARTGTETMGVPNLFGLEASTNTVLPDTVTAASLLSTNSTSNSVGNGQIQRQEQINLQVAALIVQILPNGNMVVQGKQEVRVNYEMRELTLNGIIRPEDITSANTISYEKIAEARISYGGKGQVSDLQQPRWGQQVIDIINPF
ncbi:MULTISPECIES: flagellar basal body L-ring protein FlgH [unclassified Azospirillum]|uniref:flagellar basal body L-ring protein FlgH n=1 Tax=unclassified Azospirillum TaxID=2630922 RepID=UPI000B68608E|nr:MULTISPECIES: flagellar basal body L-ring protein FlgH [unclassified Azospirillum]SNS93012.1 flagellar L-ring protein precursor FlgH [Azospirillum sp. RU38E]SNT09830.1 flagellar L-ring protein precursor FlgH [Azospirillum sp. RU37A]